MFIYLFPSSLFFEICLVDRRQTAGVLARRQSEANVKKEKLPVKTFSFWRETLPSRRSCEAKSLNPAAELCDAFVVASPQVSGVPEEQLLVFLYPGLPTTAELFILPDENSPGEHKKDSAEALETVKKKIK